MIFILVLLLDELQLSTELTEAANNAAAAPSRDVSKEAMYFGILTKKILPGATVLGFSRTGNFINKEFLQNKSETYTLVDVVVEDIQETIKNHAKDPKQMESIFKQIKQIGLNQIFFVMKILEHQEENFEFITTAADLFLTILRGNLAFHNQKSDTGFLPLLKGKGKEFLMDTFKLCKENLQNPGKDKDDEVIKAKRQRDMKRRNRDRAGVFDGILTDEENWESDLSRIKVSLNFLKSMGIFEIPPSSYETLTLTAQHLSFVEFFASVGIIISSDIEAELVKIVNEYRIRAVCFYIWNDLLNFNSFLISHSL